jgi:hypothetical protein
MPHAHAAPSRRSPPTTASPLRVGSSRTSPALSSLGLSCSASSQTVVRGDVLLVEQVDRLSRLNDADWRKLRAELDAKQIRVVALDLPTSWQLADTKDEFTSRMFGAINGMMLEIDPERTFPGSGAGCLLGREARKPFPQFIFRLLRWRGRRCDRGPRVPPIRTVLRANSQ